MGKKRKGAIGAKAHSFELDRGYTVNDIAIVIISQVTIMGWYSC